MSKLLILFGLTGLVLPTFGTGLKIASLSPQLTELVFQLGLEKELVGVSDFSDYPALAKTIPRIGSFLSPSLESIFRRNATLVLVDGTLPHNSTAHFLSSAKLEALTLTIRRVSDLIPESVKLLRRAHRPIKILDTKKMCVEALPIIGHETFLSFVWSDPYIAVGKDGFLSSLLESLGYKNLLNKISTSYAEISREWLVTHRPDRIFVMVRDKISFEKVLADLGTLWGNHPPVAIWLNDEDFSRATFTAVRSLKGTVIPNHLFPRVCDET